MNQLARIFRGGAALALVAAAAGCGSSSGTATRSTAASPSTGSNPTVYAAASLTKVFPAIDPHPKYTFGGSGALETDIEQGAPADVFAAASPKQPAQLYAKGLVGKPVEFATNTLVLIVPEGQSRAHPLRRGHHQAGSEARDL